MPNFLVFGNFGIVYRKKSELDNALTYYLKSLEIIKLGNDSAKIAAAYNNVGAMLVNTGKTTFESLCRTFSYESLYILQPGK